AAAHAGRGRSIQRGQGAAGCVLGEGPVADLEEALGEARAAQAGTDGLEVGRGVAGVGGEGEQLDASSVEPALELEAEQQVGQLALAVGGPAPIAALPGDVIEA